MSDIAEKQDMVAHQDSLSISDNVDLNKLYKMAFIYNALMDGWTIKKVNNTTGLQS